MDNNPDAVEEFSEDNRPKVLINAAEIPQRALELLQRICELIMLPNDYTKEEILEKVQGVHGIFWKDHYFELDKEIINAAGSNLRVVSTMSLEYDHIDIEDLKRRKIPLGHTLEVVNNALADAAIMLALATSRKLREGRLRIENGKWIRKSPLLGKDLQGSTIGIVGFNPVGQTIAKRLLGFEVAKILYSGEKEESSVTYTNAKPVELDELLKKSDFVIVTVPLTKETKNMCNEEFFEKMKSDSIFINISRGAIVDQNALVKALKSGRILAAGLDSSVPEPLPVDHELLSLPNCVLLPNLGCSTEGSVDEMSYFTAMNILMGIGKAPCLLTPVYEL